jgi:hypothetical protein
MMKKLILKQNVFLIITSIILFQLAPIQAKEQAVYNNEELKFTIEYPADWKQGQKYAPDIMLCVKSPDGTPELVVSVTPLNTNGTLKKAPEEYVNILKLIIPGSGDFKILSKKTINIEDGIEAVKATISWKIQNVKVLTSFFAINKNNKRIRLTCSGAENIQLEFMEGIVDSFKLKK